MSLNSNPCRLCHSTDTFIWKPRNFGGNLAPSDLQITDSRYGMTLTLLKCRTCQFIFCDKEELEGLESLYRQFEDPGYEDSQEPRSIQMTWIARKILNVKPEAKTLLDIGAGTGLLVREAQKMGMNAMGVEPSLSLAAFGRTRYGVNLLDGLFPHPDLQDRRFDVVTLVDVIEHVSDPLQLLNDARQALMPDGIVLLITPDVRSLMARMLGWKWWHYRLAHVCYFDRHTLEMAVNAAGFEVLRRFRPLWFFETGYLAARLERYIPLLDRINRSIRSVPMLDRFNRIQIPLNLYDSWGLIVRKKEADRHAANI